MQILRKLRLAGMPVSRYDATAAVILTKFESATTRILQVRIS